MSPLSPGGGGVLPMWWVIHMCRGFDPLFSLWQDRARSFWGIFSHPPTPKRSFGVLKLPILTEFDLLGPKFHLSLDLFGSNFQRPAAHPHHFSDRVPPPGLFLIKLGSPKLHFYPFYEFRFHFFSVWGQRVYNDTRNIHQSITVN